MNEWQRMWWRLSPEARDRTFNLTTQWFIGLLNTKARESPIEFASFQFDCGIKVQQIIEDRQRRKGHE